MKQMQMYSVKDTVTEKFSPPFLAENDNTAIRAFMADREKQPFPKDYALYLVGEYDDLSGRITPWAQGPMLISDQEIISAAEANNE